MPSWAFTAEGRAVDRPQDALPGAAVTFARVQELIKLRREHPALVRGGYVELWREGGQAANIFAFVRTDASDPIVVAFNNGADAAGPVNSARSAANEALSAADLALFTDATPLDELLGAGGLEGRDDHRGRAAAGPAGTHDGDLRPRTALSPGSTRAARARG